MDMHESDNDRLILKYPILLVPKKKLKAARDRFISDFNKKINIREIVQLLKKEVNKTSLLVRIQQLIPSLLNAMYLEFKITGKMTKDKELLTAYRELMGREPKTVDDILDLSKKHERLKEVYEELYPEQPNQETMSFVKLIHLIEENSPHPINRDSKVYELGGLIELAIERKSEDGRN
jgi:vacuolar-type H+-ATPase catalytic subunit A/Vma1